MQNFTFFPLTCATFPSLHSYQGTNALSNLPYRSFGNKVKAASSTWGLCCSSNLSTASHMHEKMDRVRIAHRGKDQNEPEHHALIFTVQLAVLAIWEPRLVHMRHQHLILVPCQKGDSPAAHQITEKCSGKWPCWHGLKRPATSYHHTCH